MGTVLQARGTGTHPQQQAKALAAGSPSGQDCCRESFKDRAAAVLTSCQADATSGEERDCCQRPEGSTYTSTCWPTSPEVPLAPLKTWTCSSDPGCGACCWHCPQAPWPRAHLTCVLRELAAGQASSDLLRVPGLRPHGAASADHSGLLGDCWQRRPCRPQTVLSIVQRQPRPVRNFVELQACHRTSPLLPQRHEAAGSPPKAALQAPGPAEPALASGHPAGISCRNLPGWGKAEIWDKSAALACS